jgi:hypothetical protein
MIFYLPWVVECFIFRHGIEPVEVLGLFVESSVGSHLGYRYFARWEVGGGSG